jgi:CDP-4-dehydro-6-deoxyglucose reductase
MVAQGETILDAAQREGFHFPHSCENGVCYICEGPLINGVVNLRGMNRKQTSDDSDARECLFCIAEPLSDLDIEMPTILAPGEITMQELSCQIQSCEALTDEVYKISLLAPAGNLPQYHAGQYLELLIGDKRLPFSIANAPGGRELELHIGVPAEHPEAQQILTYMQTNLSVRVALPQGECVILNTQIIPTEVPLIFVCANTGFSQIKALIEKVLQQETQPAIHLYWVNRSSEGFYMRELADQWQAEHENVFFHPLLSGGDESEEWVGRTGRIYEAIAEDFSSLSTVKVFACGSPAMVYGTLDALIEKGLKEEQMLSDVFSYAPRD